MSEQELFPIPPLLTSWTAKTVQDAMKAGKPEVNISLDLGKSEVSIKLSKKSATIGNTELKEKKLKKIIKRENVVFAIEDDDFYPLEIREEGYVKMVPAPGGLGAPTFELSGVKMHRTKDIDPYEDARTKVAESVKPGDTVFDTCGGLGYTATWALEYGAAQIYSCEINPDVIALRKYNPWTRRYLESDQIEKIHRSSAEEIQDFSTGYFDLIMHDPPRFSLSGDLYGDEFISEMSRTLKSTGILVFYTGEPYRSGRGRSFIDGVEKRLRRNRFECEYNPAIQCVVANKK